jgi:hypothetical protein
MVLQVAPKVIRELFTVESSASASGSVWNQ